MYNTEENSHIFSAQSVDSLMVRYELTPNRVNLVKPSSNLELQRQLMHSTMKLNSTGERQLQNQQRYV